MASTFKPILAAEYAKDFLKKMPLESVWLQIVQDVSNVMWMAAPWRWTLGSLPTANLLTNTSDYAITVPNDLLYLNEVYIADNTNAIPRHLKIEPTLPSTISVIGQPQRVALVGSSYRVYPKPGTLNTAPIQTLLGTYKKMAPVYTNATLYTGGTQVFPDEWFWVFNEGVLWKSFVFAEDGRAGSIQVVDGKVTYSGQRASFEDALNAMRKSESLPTLTEKPEPTKER